MLLLQINTLYIIIHGMWQAEKILRVTQKTSTLYSNCKNKIFAIIWVPCKIQTNSFICKILQTCLHLKHVFWTRSIPCRNVQVSFSNMNFHYLVSYALMLVIFSLLPVPKLCLTLYHVGIQLWALPRHPNANLACSVSHYNIEQNFWQVTLVVSIPHSNC